MSSDDQYSYQSRGLLCSVVGHLVLGLSFIIGDLFNGRDLGPETVYSITLEGGSQLGGLSQVPKKDAKEKPAPPKPVSSKSEDKVEVKEKEEVKEKDAETKPPEKEAEVSTQPEIKVSPKPEPKKEEPKKEEPKKEEDKKKKVEKPKVETPKKKDPNQQKAENDKEYLKAMQRYQGESSDAGGQGFGAAKIGGKGMGGGVVMPPEFFTYRDIVKNAMKRNWNWFDTATSLRVTLTFSISRTGEISNVSIYTSSGNSLFDQSVVRAVLKSSPLPPPPDNVYDLFKVVRPTFDPLE